MCTRKNETAMFFYVNEMSIICAGSAVKSQQKRDNLILTLLTLKRTIHFGFQNYSRCLSQLLMTFMRILFRKYYTLNAHE